VGHISAGLKAAYTCLLVGYGLDGGGQKKEVSVFGWARVKPEHD